MNASCAHSVFLDYQLVRYTNYRCLMSILTFVYYYYCLRNVATKQIREDIM